MVKKATLCVLAMLLVVGMFFNIPAKAQVATPTQAVITVSGVPAGTVSLAVPVTVDTSIITLGSPTTGVSGAVPIPGANGVGIFTTDAAGLPASFTITLPFTGVAVGTSTVTLGAVADMIGGTAIVGATAATPTSSVTVASSSTTTSSSTSGSTGSGTLSKDTFTITVTGEAVKQTSALNVTVAFADSSIATLDTAGITVSGTGISQLLVDANATTNVIGAVWSGTSTNGVVTISGMLKPGTMGGTTTFGVAKVEASGGTDITANVATLVDPTSVTNGSGSSGTSTSGSFTLISPASVTGPGKAAVAFSATGVTTGTTATLNGAKVEFRDSNSVGIAIVTVPASGSLPLSLVVKKSGTSSTVDLGSVTVTAGTGSAPKVSSASVRNAATGTKLTAKGKKFVADTTTVTIIPTDKTSTTLTATSMVVKATYDAADCIPTGSYVNVSTAAGTSAKKLSVKGACTNKLVP